MMELSVLDVKGKDTGKKVKLSSEIFGIDPNNHSIYLDVKQYLAHQRQGTHKTKERGEVAGSTRKIKKQKGTGSARSGDIKNPLFVGGGRIFGPRPRKYTQKVNKNLKKLARKSAFSIKANEKSIIVVDDINLDSPKTKQFLEITRSLGIVDKKSLFVLSEQNNTVYLASRNLRKTNVLNISNLNTYNIMNADSIVFVVDSLAQLEKNLT